MQKIIDFIYRIFGIIFFFSFFLAVLSIFLYPRVNIYGTSFNVPAFFAAIFFVSLFFIFTFTPSWKQNPKSVKGWRKYLVSLFMFFIALATAYFGIYLPFNSKLLITVPESYFNNEGPLIIQLEKDKKYYIETDSFYRLKGSELEIKFVGDDWEDSFKIIVGKKNNSQDKVSFGTSINKIPIIFPYSGLYKMYITNGSGLIKQIRLFEKKSESFEFLP